MAKNLEQRRGPQRGRSSKIMAVRMAPPNKVMPAIRPTIKL
jgi:hypothetical protein